MAQFVMGEHRDFHGRKSLYKLRFVWCGYPGRFMTRMHWIKYL
ncbi:hypothetical protein [Pseudomonas phage Astolliot]|nr:hypothetical protein [Pseudomonas phage Astolliot]